MWDAEYFKGDIPETERRTSYPNS